MGYSAAPSPRPPFEVHVSTSKRKTLNWDGPNKRRARARKVAIVARGQKSGFLPAKSNVLSFAGARAHFEKGLVGRRLTSPRRITTVQTSQKHGTLDGDKILRKLIKVRNDSLQGMNIWPYSFKSFSEGYTDDKVYLPTYTVRGGNKPSWLRTPTFYKEMERFLDKEPEKFHVLDIDICGIFSQANGLDIVRLMENDALADRGVLFINHQKGRDGRGGRLFAFLRDYFHNCELFDIDSVLDDEGYSVDLNHEDDVSWWLLRYRLVPIFYVLEAYKAGYQLEVDKLVEYRDRNKKSRVGVTMLQWYFRFRKLSSVALQEKRNMAAFVRAHDRERELLRYQLDLLADESYSYESIID